MKKYQTQLDKAKAISIRKNEALAATKRKMNYHYENHGRNKPFPEEVSNYMGRDDNLNNQPRKFEKEKINDRHY